MAFTFTYLKSAFTSLAGANVDVVVLRDAIVTGGIIVQDLLPQPQGIRWINELGDPTIQFSFVTNLPAPEETELDSVVSNHEGPIDISRAVRVFLQSTAPLVTDDSTKLYKVGHVWHDDSAGESYQLMDASVGAADWVRYEANTISSVPSGGSVSLIATVPKVGDDLRLNELTNANASIVVTLEPSDLVSVGFVASATAHDDLADTGSNTHAQIDTHIVNVANPHLVTAAQAGAEPTGTAAAAVSAHDSDAGAHAALSKVDGTRAFTGEVAGVTPTVDASLATKGFVDSADTAHNDLTSAHAARTLSGDLGGTLASPVVTALQGVDVSTDAPVNDQVLTLVAGEWKGAAGGGGGGSSLPIYSLPAIDLEGSLDSGTGWFLNVLAPMDADPDEDAIKVRSHNNTIDEGWGKSIFIPATATNMTIKIRSRPLSAPAGAVTLVPLIYFREEPDAAAVGAWAQGLSASAMDTINFPITDIFYTYFSQTETLAAWGVTADSDWRFQIHNDNSVSTLASFWLVRHVEVSFS